MANWIYNAKQDLMEYQSLCAALENIPQQIAEIEGQLTGLKSQRFDSSPVQGGLSGRESKLIDCIDRKERLKINLQIAKTKVKRIERGLGALDEKERRILELCYINRLSITAICREMAYSERNIHYHRERALSKFTLGMYGIKDI